MREATVAELQGSTEGKECKRESRMAFRQETGQDLSLRVPSPQLTPELKPQCPHLENGILPRVGERNK